MKADIAASGIVETIKVDRDGILIDGLNRLRVAWALRLESVPIEKVNPKDVLAYVISRNVARRQPTAGQIAIIGSKIANVPMGGDRRSIKSSTDNLIGLREAA